MKSIDEVKQIFLRDYKDTCHGCNAGNHSIQWVESNWNAGYDIGYTAGQAGLTGKIHEFRSRGSREMAHQGWFWYAYFMGYRDGRGDASGL